MRIKSICILQLILLCCFQLQAQKWTRLSDGAIERIPQNTSAINQPSEFIAYSLDFDTFRTGIDQENPIFNINIPLPDGSQEEFTCTSARLIPSALQDKYPEILTFDGKSRKSAKNIKWGVSDKGFHAMIMEPGKTTIFIDVINPDFPQYYYVYERGNYETSHEFQCMNTSVGQSESETIPVFGDCQLRRYRLALACTGEYAQFHGGTTESVLAEFTIAMTRVNGIYERDLGITMEFIDNTDELIFFDGNTDPYTNNSGGTMLNENQNTIDDIIGFSNYDIGHVFSTGGGGIAQLNAPCGGGKARGVTGLGSPINDPFYVDYVSHEMGHQFGANHTQNNDCNRNGSTAMEVGSGNTIMGYAGICNPNSKNASDDHFHAVSIFEITNFITNGNGDNCDSILTHENTAPVINTLAQEYFIPASTPFVLSVEAEDADGDILSYGWEQLDNEVGVMPPQSSSMEGPLFISNSPLLSPERYFPNISAIVSNNSPQWEVLPSVSRQMEFICTVRDNAPGKGCTEEVLVNLDVVGGAGPFTVLSPNTKTTWNAGDIQEITWDVANTNTAPINCTEVNIMLSVDGGFTYPIVLAENITNDGSHEITVPAVLTENARVMVRGKDNIFFDISDEDLCIAASFIVTIDNPEFSTCVGNTEVISFSTEGVGDFSEDIMISVSNNNALVNAELSADVIEANEDFTLTLSAEEETFGQLSIFTEAEGVVLEYIVSYSFLSTSATIVNQLSPADGQISTPSEAILTWENTAAGKYSLQVSTNPSFQELLVDDQNILTNSYLLLDLEPSTVYYWRVKAESPCAENTYNQVFAFQTMLEGVCESYAATDVPLDISASSTFTGTSELEIPVVNPFDYIKVSTGILHTYVGDLVATLISPTGESLTLFDRPGVPNSDFGCSEDDLFVKFFDSAPFTAEELENDCPVTIIEAQPITTFDMINQNNITGTWQLQIEDVYDEDGGSLYYWDIELCSEPIAQSVTLMNEPLTVINSQTETINSSFLSALNSNSPENTQFILRAMPTHGLLEISDGNSQEELFIGSIFTQSDIDDNKLTYTHSGDPEETDEFTFDVLNNGVDWLGNQKFNINILNEPINILPKIETEILCFGGAEGVISIIVSPQSDNYQFSIDGGENFQDSNSFESLIAGTYHLIVQDGSGMVIYDNDAFLLDQPSELNLDVNQIFYDVQLGATGGTPGYTYSLDGENFSADPIFTDVLPGNYTACVQDKNGCITKEELVVEYLPLVANINLSDILCSGDSNGVISVLAEGGFLPYLYALDDGVFQESNTFENMPSGMYQIKIQDAGGAVEVIDVELEDPDIIEISIEYLNSMLIVEAMGGNPDYLYSIDGGMTFQESGIFDEPISGNYVIVVRDANDCEAISEFTVVNTFEQESWEVLIYPVPFTSEIKIESENNLEQLKVYNTLGQVVYERRDIENNHTISTGSWIRGTYYCEMKSDKGIILRKLIKVN